jgi:GNAT superfamily N-acetyltransferase
MKPEVERLYPGEWDEGRALGILRENLERAWVVERGGETVACYYWSVEAPATAVLLSIQVAPAHRSKGLGTWLMACFEREAQACGMAEAGLAVFEGNPAMGLYCRLGYEVSGMDGPSAYEMRKALAPSPTA